MKKKIPTIIRRCVEMAKRYSDTDYLDEVQRELDEVREEGVVALANTILEVAQKQKKDRKAQPSPPYPRKKAKRRRG